MDINQYYQSGRYDNIDDKRWREQYYFPLRVQWIINALPVPFSGKILDAGCGDGAMLLELKKKIPTLELYGMDISETACRLAKEHGVQTQIADLNQKIPFGNVFFDFVLAHEVIEHLVDPDRFLDECHRVLKPGGYLVLTTPNLTAWYNRLLFLFGFHPLFYELSTRHRQIGFGLLRYLTSNSQPAGHIRVFTVAALSELLQIYGFTIRSIHGSSTPFPFSFLFQWLYDSIDALFSFFPSLSSNILLVAQKK